MKQKDLLHILMVTIARQNDLANGHTIDTEDNWKHFRALQKAIKEEE